VKKTENMNKDFIERRIDRLGQWRIQTRRLGGGSRIGGVTY